MKRLLIPVSILCAAASFAARAQLFISEFLANPPGTDMSFEYVELIAASAIDFSVSPYSVVFANNGNATANGWVQGAGVTYGFNLTSGSVQPGDVVYVGGSGMAPTGTKLRTIDTATTGGDGFGNASNSGVLGNGGANADGIALFATDIFNVTMSLAPVDAIFFGTGAGTAIVNGGVDGYELPVNDVYNGGTLQSASFLAPEPGNGTPTVAAGAYDAESGAWTTPRTWTVTDGSDGVSSVTVTPVPEPSVTLLILGGALTCLLVRWRK